MSDGPDASTDGPAAAYLDGLAEAARQGDQDAFADLIRACLAELRCYIAARSPTTVSVDEVVQDVFVIAHSRLADYEARGLLIGWLKGIARLQLLEILRRQGREQRRAGDRLAATLADRCAEQCLVEQHAADETRQFESDALQRCLERLAPRARLMVQRRHQDGLSLNRLAQQFKISADAISGRLRRIRSQLRDCLIQEGIRP